MTQCPQPQQPPEKILLLLMPFWDPEIPPQGISCLKSYLTPHGYQVKTADGNTRKEFREAYFRYYRVLQNHIPVSRRQNLFNTGVILLRNHLMAHIYHTDKEQYYRFLKILIEKTFCTPLDNNQLAELDGVIAQFYERVEHYFLGLLAEEKPTVVGFSAFSGSLPAALFACRLAKQKSPDIKTVLGGQVFSDQLMVGTPDFDYFMEKTAAYVDGVIVGEGEQLFLAWLRGELPTSKRVFTLQDIDNKAIDIDTAASPDYTDFDLSYYPHIAVYGSRSCPFQCSFCSETVYWGKYRKKKIPQLVEELKRLHEIHSTQLFLLTDSLLNPTVTELATEISKSGYCFYWDGYLRADPPVRKIDNTLLWRRGGFYRAKLGLESGSPKILQKMGKHITIPQVKEAIYALAYAGIKTTTAWMVGHPGETEEDFLMTLALIEELKDYIYEVKLQSFNYYLRGQPNSTSWIENQRPVLFYPEWAKDMLVCQTWRLDGEPTWEDTIRRVNRFMEHCRRLGLPSNYSLEDVNAADIRWKKLQPNAVPALVDLQDKNNYIDECKYIEKFNAAVNPPAEDGDWL
ncbi:MAG TPA: radical SAM protein [Candidatus Deferrimicrobium sp.]|nr:radical SAM protein [Candidatus Deferrimicrobium sp.]